MVFRPTPLKNDGVKVSWDDYSIPNIWKVLESHKIPWFQSPPTRYRKMGYVPSNAHLRWVLLPCLHEWGNPHTIAEALKYHLVTSSTAQGGGGSFKNRKPIEEVGCCESGMAERSHWWTERCLISLTLSISFSDYLPTYLPIYFLCIYLSIYLSIYLI